MRPPGHRNEIAGLPAGTWYACSVFVASRILILAVSAALLATVAPARADDAPRPTTAQPAGTRVSQSQPDSPAARTDAARARLATATTERGRLRADKARMLKRHQKKLGDIDRLKRQRASWRRDRQLRTHLKESQVIARKLSALDQRLRKLAPTIRRSRAALVTLIDRELASSPDRARRTQLARWRRSARRGMKKKSVKKIVLPEDDIDPLADPEELEYQASLLRQSEQQLAREFDRLEKQEQRYRHMVALREKYSRADELTRFDDDRPRRTTGRAGDRNGLLEADGPEPASDDAQAPPGNPEADPGIDSLNDDFGGTPGADDPRFDIVLADVVDDSTVRALRAAGGSRDPKAKARAAERARLQVKKRIERLQNRRKLMQKRARSLRLQRR